MLSPCCGVLPSEAAVELIIFPHTVLCLEALLSSRVLGHCRPGPGQDPRLDSQTRMSELQLSVCFCWLGLLEVRVCSPACCEEARAGRLLLRTAAAFLFQFKADYSLWSSTEAAGGHHSILTTSKELNKLEKQRPSIDL